MKYFNIRYLDPVSKRWKKSTYKMNEEIAHERFGHTEWEVIAATIEERRGDVLTMGHLLRGPNGK